MTHRLEKQNPKHFASHPMIATLRYRCNCANNEVLTINCVIDKDMDADTFSWAMREMWRDMDFEIRQHLAKNDEPVK